MEPKEPPREAPKSPEPSNTSTPQLQSSMAPEEAYEEAAAVYNEPEEAADVYNEPEEPIYELEPEPAVRAPSPVSTSRLVLALTLLVANLAITK